CALADAAQKEGGDGNSNLGCGDVAIEIANRVLHGFGRARAFGGELVDAGFTNGDEREFGRDEKTVQKYQGEYYQQLQGNCSSIESWRVWGHRKNEECSVMN